MLSRFWMQFLVFPLFFYGHIFPAPFFVTNNADSGGGSLRAAIAASNGAIGDPQNTITFSTGFAITLTSGNLAPITHPVIINDTLEAVTVDGNATASIGFQIEFSAGGAAQGGGTGIQGITLKNFKGANGTSIPVTVGKDAIGILINGSNNNELSSNSLSAITGGTGGSPIVPFVPGVRGGNAFGILAGGTGNLVTTNSVSLITAGTGGSGGVGVGPLPGGHGGDGGNAFGAFLTGATNTVMQSNSITTVAAGSGGNGGNPNGIPGDPGIAVGIWVQNNSVNNLIGDLTDNMSLGNSIFDLTQPGARGIVISDASSFDNTIESNSIFNIDGKGIDLQGLGNNNQDAPTIATISSCSGGAIGVAGTLNNAIAGTPYHIQFFNNGVVSAIHEGKTLIGAISFVGTGVPVQNFAASFMPIAPVVIGDFITATATVELGSPDPAYGDSSEFSNEVSVTANPDLSVNAGDPQEACTPVNVQLNATPSGGTPGYTYLWTPDTGLSNPAISNPVASPAMTTMYIVTVTDSVGCSATDSVTITVNQSPIITEQPGDQTVCEGAMASFTATASGIPEPAVQWQVSVNGGVTFTDIGGATNTTYSFAAGLIDSGNRYRAVVTTNGCSVVTSTALLTVHQVPVIIQQPDNQVVCFGATVSFTAAASGIPTPSVQWQVSTNDGVTFIDIGSATNATYSFTPVLSDSGNQYRAMFTNLCDAVPTNAATLTVNPLPTISTSANPTVITLGQSSTLTATLGSGTPPYFVTFSDGFISPVSVNTSVTHEVSPTTTTTYSAVVTDSLDCESDPLNTITLTVLSPVPPPSDLKVVICGPRCRVTKSRKPRIRGRTTPGALVSLYANSSLVAKTKANNKGVFVVKPCCMLKRGCNTLVAQAVNNAGSTARSNCIKINVKS